MQAQRMQLHTIKLRIQNAAEEIKKKHEKTHTHGAKMQSNMHCNIADIT